MKRGAARAKGLNNDEIAILTGVPSSRIAEFREIFRLIDIDGNNTLSIAELRNLLEVCFIYLSVCR